MHIDRLTEK